MSTCTRKIREKVGSAMQFKSRKRAGNSSSKASMDRERTFAMHTGKERSSAQVLVTRERTKLRK